MGLILVAAIAIGLFAAAFITKRRFGVLILALTAGIVLSNQLAPFTGEILTALDLNLPNIDGNDLAKGLLILTPTAVLLISGPKYGSRLLAGISALVFAIFATLLFVQPMLTSLSMSASVKNVLETALQNMVLITPIMIIIALLDVVGTKFARPHKKSKH
jgi:hypothetical protein